MKTNMLGMDRNRLGVIGIVLAAILFLAINVLAGSTLRSGQLDLTERKLFTLSDATRRVLANLEEPITLRLFFTRELGDAFPDQAAYHARVREFLERYATLADGKIRLEFLNPEPFSEEEDRAVTFGLRGVPYTSTGDHGYFGLAGSNAIDGQETIAFFNRDRERFLEFDLTKLVYNLTTLEQPTIGLISTLPIEGGFVPGRPPQQPWAVVDQIREFFDLKALPAQIAEVPEDVDVLMIVHPRELNQETLYAIDQFALKGGAVLAFVDPNPELQPVARGQAVQASDLGPLLETWGVEMVPGQLATDIVTARRVNVRHQGQIAVTSYVAWNTLTRDNMAIDETVIGDITTLNIGTAGILKAVEGATTELTPILRTTEKSQALPIEKIQGRIDIVALFRDFQASGVPLTMAAKLSGEVKTVFPDGRPAADGTAASDAFAAHRSASEKPLNVIVVADTDILHEGLWADVGETFGERVVVPFAGNGNFVINALETLSGGDALAGLRSRDDSQRPFQLVEDLRLEAEQEFRTKQEELTSRLRSTQDELLKLTSREQSSSDAVLSDQEKQAIDGFRRDMVLIRRDLRDVQHELRKDIDALDNRLKLLNIAAIPTLLILIAIGLGLVRRARRKPVGGAA